MGKTYMISDAAKEVNVESHVLRYWEEELGLPIKRNELGHRYYTQEDIILFRQIKDLKDRGLQLRAIKGILREGKIREWTTDITGDALEQVRKRVLDRERANLLGGIGTMNQEDHIAEETEGTENVKMGITILESRDLTMAEKERMGQIMERDDGKDEQEEIAQEEKARKIRYLLQQIIHETVKESSQEICKDIKESVLKELDYQFRLQEERQEEREQIRFRRSEEYYRRMDELLREKSGREDRKGRRKIWQGFLWHKPESEESIKAKAGSKEGRE